jgi:tetratricopeptide (TPR) repeat protein
VLARGTLIARYIVLDPLGHGGLGEVYAAYDPELDRRVAIKLLVPHGGGRTTKFERRLVREGRALAKVSHANVVAVHDVGTFGDRVFIAMELVEGVTLGAWLGAAPRSWNAIRDVFLGAAAGLHEAHRCGLVHRDFKPSNAIVDRDGRPKVLDFGLARAAAEANDGEDSSSDRREASPATAADDPPTKTGALVGTPAYMAPEQLAGAQVDARADQFSFCVALYEAMYGRRPFGGNTFEALHAAIEQGRPLEPTVDRRAPAWMRRAIVRGLAFDPEKRYASMAELAAALAEDRRGWRRPWLAVAASVVLATGIAIAAATSDRADAAQAGTDVVESLANDARAAAAKSWFVYPPPDDADYRTANRVVVELEALAEPATELGRERAAALRAEFAETLARLGDRFWDSEGGAPFAIDYYAQALVFDPTLERARQRATLTPGELASLRTKADNLSFSPAELVAAEPLAVLAEPDEAERKRRLATLYGREHAPGVSTTARLERVLGDEVGEIVRRTGTSPRTVGKSKSADEPLATAPRDTAPPEPPALDESARKPGLAKYTTAAEARVAGKKAFAAGRFGEAEALLGRALQLDPKDAESAHTLAELHFERGATARAADFAARAVKARPKNAGYRLLLGDCLRKLGRIDDARAHYEAARDLGHSSAAARLAKLDAAAGGP